MLTPLVNRPTPPNGNAGRAMYVWVRPATDPMANESTQQALITFCAANGVNVLFLDIWSYLGRPNMTEAKAARMRAFLDAAYRSGIRTYALSGNVDWGVQHAWVMGNIVDPLIAFNAAGKKPGERFEGMSLDIEYYQNPAQYPPAIHLPGQCELIRAIRGRTRMPVGAFAAFAMKGPAAASVQYAGKVAQEGEHLMDVCDFVVVGSYRDTAPAQIGVFQPWYDYARTQRRPVGLFAGTETIAVPESYVTFFGQTKAVMESQHAQVSAAFTREQNAVFLGHSVHDYDGYRAMR